MDAPIAEKKEKKMYGKYDKWDIEDAARTLEQAEEIKADSEKMKYVEECLEKKVKTTKKAYKTIADMRADYKEMEDEGEE